MRIITSFPTKLILNVAGQIDIQDTAYKIKPKLKVKEANLMDPQLKAQSIEMLHSTWCSTAWRQAEEED